MIDVSTEKGRNSKAYKERNELLESLVNYLKTDKFFNEHIYSNTWVSGESTEVPPIIIWNESIEVQWKTDTDCPKWIKSVVNAHKGILDSGFFWKSDGSCPSNITFFFKDKYCIR